MKVWCNLGSPREIKAKLALQWFCRLLIYIYIYVLCICTYIHIYTFLYITHIHMCVSTCPLKMHVCLHDSRYSYSVYLWTWWSSDVYPCLPSDNHGVLDHFLCHVEYIPIHILYTQHISNMFSSDWTIYRICLNLFFQQLSFDFPTQN